jgi:putative transposase
MTEKFQNKYRIPSARLQDWDYGANGSYFITICTQNREHYFGEISNDEMQLNEMGDCANKFWDEIPKHFPFVELGNYVVMPNHVHGILIIDKPVNDGNSESIVETRLIASLSINDDIQNKKVGGFAGDKNPMFHENISRVIRWYKGRCSFEIGKLNGAFAWQPRFHDHIIRNAESFDQIQNYIQTNPSNWDKDKFH